MVARGKWALVGAVVVGVAVVTAAVLAQGPPVTEAQSQPASEVDDKRSAQIEPKAEEVLRGMSQYLAGLQSFSFTAESVDETVLKSGQKLQFPASSEVYVKRPDRLRTDRTGVVKLSLYYDGSQISLYGHRKNLYATTVAPSTLDEMIEFARTHLHIEAPGADLLYSAPYGILTEDVVSGRHVGMATIDGQIVHHLAFKGNQTDWQIWIEEGATPLPRRFVITSKHVRSVPEFTVSLRDWDVSPRLPDDLFTFKPPQGAKKIDFDQVWERAQAERTRRQAESPQRGAPQ